MTENVRNEGLQETLRNQKGGDLMSDILRTALKGGGSICISINLWANGDFHLQVTEEWARLTAPEQSVITAEQLAAAEDPDAMIRKELERMVEKAHLNYEVRRK